MTSTSRAESFLQIIRRAERGRLKVYLGYSPGVGKTFQMLQEAQRLKSENVDVVIGVTETHGRKETAAMVQDLPVIPRRREEVHGVMMDEMDLDAILARKPQVVLVDELAHTNLPGSRNMKRYQDVQDILDAGIHVISTMNVQHLESLYDTVEKLIGVKVMERVPDSVLAEADQVVNVDLTPEDLQKRLREGRVYHHDRVATALDNFFTGGNLEQLRELTLREMASQIDFKRREQMEQQRNTSPDQVMVCLSSRGPNSAMLLRHASRLAGRLNRNWYAVYVQTPSEEPTVIDATTQRLLADTLTLANQLGAMVFTFKGQDVVDTIVRFAKEYRVGHVVIGRPGKVTLWQRLRGQGSVAERLIHEARGLSIVVIDAQAEERFATRDVKPAAPAVDNHAPLKLSEIMGLSQIVVWDEPVTRAQIFHGLTKAIAARTSSVDLDFLRQRLDEREKQGSTFLNEGVALPHARLPGIQHPLAAMGIVRGGVIDAQTQYPIEVVLLLISPESEAETHLKLLAAAAHLLQDRHLRRKLLSYPAADRVLSLIQDAESARALV